MRLNRVWGCLFSCLLCIASVTAQAEDKTTVAASVDDTAVLGAFSRAVSNLAAKARPAVVSIYTTRTMKAPDINIEIPEPFREMIPQAPTQPQQPREFQSKGLGSGFVIDSEKGYILTNNHVVEGAEDIKVRLKSGDEVTGKLIGTDKQTDIAVIQIEAKGLTALTLGDSDKLRVGEFVMAIGSPFGLRETVSTGIVSGLGRTGLGIEQYEDFIQTDAAINVGNSGGPLLNDKGEAIGVNTAIVSRSGGSVGVGFAIPIKMAKGVVDQLIKNGTVTRGWLGVSIQEVTPELAKKFGMDKAEGALVTEVFEGTPAGQGGMKMGDVILDINGQKIENVTKLRSLVAAIAPDTTVPVIVLREGKNRTLSIQVGKQTEQAIAAATGADKLQVLGLTVQTLTPEVRNNLGLNANVQKGVAVVEVKPGSLAEQKGIRRGNVIVQVNRKQVSTAAEFNAAIKSADLKDGVLLLVVTNQGNSFVVLQEKSSDK